MSWRGKQSPADRNTAMLWAQRLDTYAFKCVVCRWICAYDGSGYESLLDVCGRCASRIMNLSHRQHGGEWWNIHQAEPEDLQFFGDTLDSTRQRDEAFAAAPRPYKKKKISTPVRLKVYERDGFKCVYCGARKGLSLDHVTAESKGGATEVGNLVTACRSCNSRKKTKSLADFWEALQ